MSIAEVIAWTKRFDRNAEVIFDQEEPIGAATDLVMPWRRRFRFGARNSGDAQTFDRLAGARPCKDFLTAH